MAAVSAVTQVLHDSAAAGDKVIALDAGTGSFRVTSKSFTTALLRRAVAGLTRR
ncbi:MAG: hypothetical protein WBN23_08355 [Woeseia sp.]